MPRFQPTQARGENHPPIPVGVCKNEGESRGKEGKEAQGGGWVGGMDSTLPFAGSLTDIPLPPPVLLTAREEKMGASSSCTLPSPGLGATIDLVCFRGLQGIGWESEEEAVQSSLSVIREIKDRFHRPQPTSMCSMN